MQHASSICMRLSLHWQRPCEVRWRDSFTGGPTRLQSLNRYAYTENNPVNWTNPSGRCVGWLWRDPTCQFIGRDRVARGDLEWAEALDPLQVGLDVVGMVPGFGEPADGLNGGISLLRGDRVGAALSFGSMVPFAGWGATVAKWGRRGMRLGDAGRGVRAGPAAARGHIPGRHADRASILFGKRPPGARSSIRPTRYHTRVAYNNSLPAGTGGTTRSGFIQISPHGTDLDRTQALYHELVHRHFTPRHGPFLNTRRNASMWVYNYSHLARYTEEALAESIAQLRTRGSFLQGISHPFSPYYKISKTRLFMEGTALSTIVIAGGIGTGTYVLPPVIDAWEQHVGTNP